MSRRRFNDQDLCAVWQSRRNARIPANQHQTCKDICDIILNATHDMDPGSRWHLVIVGNVYQVSIPSSTNRIDYEWINAKGDRLRYV